MILQQYKNHASNPFPSLESHITPRPPRQKGPLECWDRRAKSQCVFNVASRPPSNSDIPGKSEEIVFGLESQKPARAPCDLPTSWCNTPFELIRKEKANLAEYSHTTLS